MENPEKSAIYQSHYINNKIITKGWISYRGRQDLHSQCQKDLGSNLSS